MPEQGFQEKTERATPKRREESRKKGQVGKSRELSSIAVLSGGAIYLYFRGEHHVFQLGGILKRTFLDIPAIASGEQDLFKYLVLRAEDILWMVLPIMIVLSVVAVLANALQTGLLLSVEALTPSASKLNPVSGLKRLLSKRSLVELAKSIAKLVIVGWVALSTLKAAFPRLIPITYQEPSSAIFLLGQESMSILIKCCCVIFLLAMLDYYYQRWQHEENIKMTKQEVKDEHKQTEGDPMVKGRIRSIQREMARKRMMAEVPEADVVITNPVRLAVALRYDPGKGQAPVVVAKGSQRIAARIREIALEHDVPIVENRPLAQNLYNLELGDEIPAETYQAVAEILAYVYGLKKKPPATSGRTP
ncbi:MAG: flagellar biosynthesis protein FlhB [Thermodesulfobacteriota bacterium]